MTNEQIKAEAKERYPNIDAYGLTLARRNAWIAARTLSMQEREKVLEFRLFKLQLLLNDGYDFNRVNKLICTTEFKLRIIKRILK